MTHLPLVMVSNDALASAPDIITSDTIAQPADKKCQLSKAYPAKVRAHCQLIEKYARKNNLPANLVAALIWQESGGNPKAYSKSGAVGLMQIMAKDGLSGQLYGSMFASRPTVKQLYDPEYNVKWGTRFLASLYKRHGNYRDALKYYGPANVGYYYADIVLRLAEKGR